MTDRVYYARNTGNVIRIIDSHSGITAGQIPIRGEVLRDAIVQGDTCTYIARVNNATYGFTHKVPTGALIRQFTV